MLLINSENFMQTIYKYNQGQKKVYIDSHDLPAIKTSYIDAYNLLHCLKLYYLNELDNIDEFLDRLYLPESQLNPSNSLFGQLDSTTMNKALNQLPEHYQLSLKLYHVPNSEDSSKIQHYYNYSDSDLKFAEWVGDLYIQAFIALAEEVKRLI